MKIKFIILIVYMLSVLASSQIRLPKLISDGVVLQRDVKVKVWGWASKDEKVSLRFMNSTYNTKADNNGDWYIILPKMKAGGPYQMEIVGSNKIVINDIVIGDVWVCSGQSNMELTMDRVSPIYEDEIANSANVFIRQFEVPDRYNFNHPEKDFLSGEWQKANPENVLRFSAAAYFFAKELYARYKVPIGIINTALGGSPVQSWMSEEALKQFPMYYGEAKKFKDTLLIKKIDEDDNKRIGAWYNLSNQKDAGYKDSICNWYSPILNTENWDTMNIPGYWAEGKLGKINGVVWFRKKINIPLSLTGKEAKLNLGRIVDADSVYVNGKFIGTTSYQYPPRRYKIPVGLLKEGENTIVIRVINSADKGGFVLDKPYQIIIDKDTIDLKGIWQYKLGTEMPTLASQTFIRWKPLGLYNAMIAPLLNFSIKGVLWYQGESNASNPTEYKNLFVALIKDWRKNWKEGEFPFLFVQLPNFMESTSKPSESNWALLREAQLKSLSLPKTGMAVTIDIGEWNDIHPLDKKDVGKRLSLLARKIAYNEKNLVASGPIYKSMKVDGNKIILTFTNTGSGLIAKGKDDLNYFSICGKDKKFIWAKAKIENNKVVVWNDKIVNPVAVRYAWADNPEGANLYNKEGLPAAPFRTDNFQH